MSVVVEFANVLLRVLKQGDGWIASQLIDLLTATSSKMSLFKRYINIVAESEDVATRNTKELVNDDKFIEAWLQTLL